MVVCCWHLLEVVWCIDKFGRLDTTLCRVRSGKITKVVCSWHLPLGIVEVLRDLEDIRIRRCVVCKTRTTKSIVGVVCDQTYTMVGQEPMSFGVRVFMTKEEALCYKLEYVDSQ